MSIVQMQIDSAFWKPQLEAKEKELQAYSQTIASMSAALLGFLQPGQPYEGNATSVAEAMQVRRCLSILARELCVVKAAGRYDVDDGDVQDEIRKAETLAKAEITVIYAKEPK